jgi:hypothetical protein
MNIRVKKPVTKEKLENATNLLVQNRSKQKGFAATKFFRKIKGVFDDTLSAIKRQEILRDLEDVPVERLDEIESFLKNILSQFNVKKPKEPKSLKGIWAKKGFEKIIDLEAEILEVRKELDAQLLKKKL